MTKYRVAYIDESEADIRKFQRSSFNYFDIVPIVPLPSFDETIEKIMESNVDAIIADFDLSEQNPEIHFDGTALVRKILKNREGFPVFILTSFEDDAISSGDDVNIVYEKMELDEGNNFLERVKTQIEKYKYQLELDEKRILELLSASHSRDLNVYEKQELNELDSKIEKALDKESQIPNDLRNETASNKLAALIDAMDKLVKTIRKSND